MALFRYGFKREYVEFCESFHEGLCVQLTAKFFCLETFVVYSNLLPRPCPSITLQASAAGKPETKMPN